MDVDREIAIIDLNQQLTDGKSLAEVLSSVEARYIQRALLRSDGNRHAAARLLGIDIAYTRERSWQSTGSTVATESFFLGLIWTTEGRGHDG